MWLYEYYDFFHTDNVLLVCGKRFGLCGFPLEFGIRFFFLLLALVLPLLWRVGNGEKADSELYMCVRNIKVELVEH